jgi:GNAT superfamily N-acetyltransferase
MVRADLESIPQHDLPGGYAMREYRDGDRETWLRVQQAAETHENITEGTFDKNFVPAERLEGRMMFLVSPEGKDCGTITAWFDDEFQGKSWGRIHWVAITPEHRGKGLCKPIVTAAMNRLAELGHERAILGTQTVRRIAIKVYLDFDFLPLVDDDESRRTWGIVAEHLDHPLLREAIRGEEEQGKTG